MPFNSVAHPSWGIVSTSDGTIYFVDVLHNHGTLWKYDVGTRKLESIFDGHFHAHNLQVDQNDNLYIGLHIWIDGEIMGDGENYLMKYDTKNKTLDTLAFAVSYEALFGGNVLYDYHCEDYFYAHEKQLWKGNVVKLDAAAFVDFNFERISTMAFDRNQNLWITDSFLDHGSLYKIDSTGKIEQYAHHLIPRNPIDPVYSERNHQLLYGISFDILGNPIVTQSASREVVKINSDQSIELLYKSPKHFFPVGTCMVNSKLVIMEVGFVPGKGHVGPSLIILEGDNQEVHKLFE